MHCLRFPTGLPRRLTRFSMAAVLFAVGTMAFAATVATPVEAAVKSYHPSGFAPQGQPAAIDLEFDISWFDSRLSGDGCYGRDLDLPDRATITKVKLYYEAGASESMHFQISRNKIVNATEKKIIGDVLDKSLSGRTVKEYTLSETVRLNKFAYLIAVCVNPGDHFYGVRIN